MTDKEIIQIYKDIVESQHVSIDALLTLLESQRATIKKLLKEVK